MKYSYLFVYILIFMSIMQSMRAKKHDAYKAKQLLELLSIAPENLLKTRAPAPPSSLTTSIGSVNFQAYNGGSTTPYTQGANVTAYYGATGAPISGNSMPANIIFNTVPAANTAPTPRVFVGSNGRIGIGSFDASQGSSINAALHVEGNNNTGVVSPGPNNAMFVGPRTTTLNPFVTAATGSMQVTGNMFVQQTMETPKFTGYGVFSPLNWTPIRNITFPITINEFPYTINTPGKYVLYQHTVGISGPAIIINASDVILDLQGFRLQSSGNVIQINSGLSNITIRNGEVQGDGATTAAAIDGTSATGLSNISFENLIIANVAGSGINLGGGNNLVIDNVRMRNVVSAISNSAAISLTGFNTINLNNVIIGQAGSSGLVVNGIALTNCANGLLQNVSVLDCIGFSIRCFLLNSATNMIFRSCVCASNIASVTCDSFVDNIEGSSPFCQFFDCISVENVGADIVRGFQFFANSTYVGCVCQSLRNTATSSAILRGFNTGDATVSVNCICAHCTTNDTASTATTAYSNSGSSRVSGYIDCLAYNNCTNNVNAVGFSVGFPPIRFFRNCCSSNHPIAYRTAATGMNVASIENVATAYTTAFSNYPLGSNQTIANINGLTTLMSQNPWINTGIN